MQAVIKENEDSELSAMRRTEENMEELRRDNQKRVEHSPIGDPLSLALENVAILWWATPPEN